jgi:hypothetical protein
VVWRSIQDREILLVPPFGRQSFGRIAVAQRGRIPFSVTEVQHPTIDKYPVTFGTSAHISLV